MQLLFAYLLKLALCLALGYLFYFLLLRRMTYYTWNRYFLLFFSLAALAIPLLPVQMPGDIRSINAVFFITDILPAVDHTTLSKAGTQNIDANINNLVLAVMLTGMFFFLVRFILRFYSLRRTRSAAELVKDGEIKLYHLAGCEAPFSFSNSVYLDIQRYDQQELEKILAHELVHINQKHTIDMLVAELLSIIQWFNPFVWCIKYAIKQNLEFIADDSVLQKGISRTGYQYLLLKVSGAMPYTLANNLLFPSLKKRIHMMNRTKTGRIHLLKYMCIIPLGCVLLFSFSGSTEIPTTNMEGTVAVSPESFSLSSLSFYINDEQVAELVKKEKEKSFLKAGGPLSLSLISEEKTRLQDLLAKNGYEDLGNHAITFVMDTSATNHSFSIQVTINLEKTKKHFQETRKNKNDPAAINMPDKATHVHYAMSTVQQTPGEHTPDLLSPGYKPVTANGTTGKQ
jgi:beta-lactamase regulating signal transducer with metallopeptidase domain